MKEGPQSFLVYVEVTLRLTCLGCHPPSPARSKQEGLPTRPRKWTRDTDETRVHCRWRGRPDKLNTPFVRRPPFLDVFWYSLLPEATPLRREFDGYETLLYIEKGHEKQTSPRSVKGKAYILKISLFTPKSRKVFPFGTVHLYRQWRGAPCTPVRRRTLVPPHVLAVVLGVTEAHCVWGEGSGSIRL